MLKTLRERGFKAVVFEAGGDIGGTWRFNSYPGARVDSAVPEYKFSWPEVYKTWTWTTNYVSSPYLKTSECRDKLAAQVPARGPSPTFLDGFQGWCIVCRAW